MAKKMADNSRVSIVLRKGQMDQFDTCSRETVARLKSPTTDLHIKQQICDYLVSGGVETTDSQQPGTSVSSVVVKHTNDELDTAEQSECKSSWTPSAEKLLLTKLKETEDSKTLVRNKWKTIAFEIKKYNYNFSPEQCRLKIKCMKEKFERNKKKENTSGESPASTDNDELDEVFETFPDSNPKCIIESGTKKQPVPSSSGFKGKEMRRPISPGSSDDCKLEEPDTIPNVKKPRRSVDVMRELIMEISKAREDAAEKRHKEKLEMVNSLIGVLKDVARK